MFFLPLLFAAISQEQTSSIIHNYEPNLNKEKRNQN